MSAPLSRAWVVCRVLDDAANDRRERSVARALALSAETRENPHNSWRRDESGRWLRKEHA